jgi:uncharacterized membrane protein YgcG
MTPRLRSRPAIRFSAGALAAALVAVLLLVFAPSGQARADVENFNFSSWRTEIDVSVDEGLFGGQVVRSDFTETITAEFPDFDQNRGIVRAIPVEMGESTMRIEDVSVTDPDGNPVPYETEQEWGANDYVILVGDDNYVQGSTTYVIKYSLVNTLTERDYTNPEAMYAPNLTPPYRQQAIDSFSAQVRIDTTLWDAVQELPSWSDEPGYEGLDANCFVGQAFSDVPCAFDVVPGDEYEPGTDDFTPSEPLDASTTVITIAPIELGTNDVTLDLRMSGDSVQLPNWFEKLSTTQQLNFGAVVLLFFVAIAAFIALQRSRKPKPLTPIVTRYSTDISPIRAAVLLQAGREPKDRPAFSAQVLDTAVRGGVTLEEEAERRGKPLVRVRFANEPEELPSQTRKFRNQVLRMNQEGESTLLAPNSKKLADSWRKFANSAVKGVHNAKLAEVSSAVRLRKRITALALALFVAAVVLLVIQCGHVAEDLMFVPMVSGLLGIVGLITLFGVLATNERQLTHEGRVALTELHGLRQYLELAEEDRLRALQGPETAERVTGAGPNPIEVIHVYERLLPYAVLFGMSDEWAELIETKYQEAQAQPSYVSGRAAGIVWANQQIGIVNPTYTSPSSGSGYSGSSSSFSGGGSAGGGFGGGSVGGR